MRDRLRTALLLLFTSLGLYVISWMVAGTGLLGDFEFGYYGGFNTAKHAIQRSGCAERIEFSGVNKDVFLEEFHFRITTKSGKVVRMWFDASNMDVAQVCYRPVGLAVNDPSHEEGQVYTIDCLSGLLKERNIQVTSLRDLLCHLDELADFFQTHRGNNNDILKTDPYIWDYLRVEFPEKRDLDSFGYADINDKDIVDWP